MKGVIYSGPIRTEAKTSSAGANIGFGIACMVYASVVLLVGDVVPAPMYDSAIYVLIAGALFIGAGIFKYRRARRHLEIVQTGLGTYAIQISNTSGKILLAVESPFRVEYGWTQERMPTGAGNFREVYLAFFDLSGQSIWTLKYALGIRDPNPDFAKADHDRLQYYEKIYTGDEVREIARHFIEHAERINATTENSVG